MGFILLTKFKVCCEVLFVISAMSNSFFFVTVASYLLSGADPHPSLISGTILGFSNKENPTLFVPGIV